MYLRGFAMTGAGASVPATYGALLDETAHDMELSHEGGAIGTDVVRLAEKTLIAVTNSRMAPPADLIMRDELGCPDLPRPVRGDAAATVGNEILVVVHAASLA